MDELKSLKALIPLAPDTFVTSVLSPESPWHDIIIDCLGWIEMYPEDQHLKKLIQDFFTSLSTHEIIYHPEAPDEVDALERAAIALTQNIATKEHLPLTVSILLYEAMRYRRKLESSLEDLFCCLLDFEYGYFDALLYASLRSLITDVAVPVSVSAVMAAFGKVIYKDCYARARSRFLKESKALADIPLECPYLEETIFCDEKYSETYGRRFHLASLEEPESERWASWKLCLKKTY